MVESICCGKGGVKEESDCCKVDAKESDYGEGGEAECYVGEGEAERRVGE